jgi:hypothetical protein
LAAAGHLKFSSADIPAISFVIAVITLGAAFKENELKPSILPGWSGFPAVSVKSQRNRPLRSLIANHSQLEERTPRCREMASFSDVRATQGALIGRPGRSISHDRWRACRKPGMLPTPEKSPITPPIL